MNRVLSGVLVGLGFMAAMAMTPAAAQVATYQGSFSAAFTSGPFSFAQGTFSVTYDDTLKTFGTANSIDITVDGGPHYTVGKFVYQPTAYDQLMIGTDCGKSGGTLYCGLTSGLHQFQLSIHNLSSAEFDYASAGVKGIYFTRGSNVKLNVQRVPVAAVPEPTVWALMIVGFAGLGFAARRRRLAAV